MYVHMQQTVTKPSDGCIWLEPIALLKLPIMLLNTIKPHNYASIIGSMYTVR